MVDAISDRSALTGKRLAFKDILWYKGIMVLNKPKTELRREWGLE